MKVYVEFKPCYFTKYLTESGIDKMPIVPYSSACFVDGENNNLMNGTLYLTKDLKYVVCFYNRVPSYYRVTSVSSKPISYEVDKVKEWYKITKEINKLKEQRKKLMH
jgi:hypothetical protein